MIRSLAIPILKTRVHHLLYLWFNMFYWGTVESADIESDLFRFQLMSKVWSTASGGYHYIKFVLQLSLYPTQHNIHFIFYTIAHFVTEACDPQQGLELQKWRVLWDYSEAGRPRKLWHRAKMDFKDDLQLVLWLSVTQYRKKTWLPKTERPPQTARQLCVTSLYAQ